MVGGVITLCLGMVIIGALMPQQEASRHAPAVAAPAAPVVPSLPALPDPADSPEADAGIKASALVKVPDLKVENAAVAADELRKLGFTNIQFGSTVPARWKR